MSTFHKYVIKHLFSRFNAATSVLENEPRTLARKAAVLTTTLGPPPKLEFYLNAVI